MRSKELSRLVCLVVCAGGAVACGSDADKPSPMVADVPAGITMDPAQPPVAGMGQPAPMSTQVPAPMPPANNAGTAAPPAAGMEAPVAGMEAMAGMMAGASGMAGMAAAGMSGGEVPDELFSFFVTSLRALQDLSGSEDGFGGDLRFGEEGPGSGLRGADKICATIAERSMPGAGNKEWRAFLSAAAGEDGQQVNAIDRIGEGPWYDRLGRVFAENKADLLHFRPESADPAIANDMPNEDGVPNHDPDGTGQVDNHDTLTGSNAQGQLYNANATCLDWTSDLPDPSVSGLPRVGHSWPRFPGGGGGFPGGGFPGGGGNGEPNDGDGYGHWISSLDEAGCGPSVRLIEMGGPMPQDPTVGSGGGYGGFYCFSLTP